MRKSFYFFFALFLFACSQSTKNNSTPQPLFPEPGIVMLDTVNGYVINSITTDSIKPIINSFGDTIQTGVSIPVIGKIINPQDVKPPHQVAAYDTISVNAHPNVFEISESPVSIPVNQTIQKKVLLGMGSSRAVLINSIGDTVLTGKPFKANGKKIICNHPQATNSLPARVKDNATVNIHYLDVDQGMSSSTVKTIIQDRSGNIWFGTSGGGATKFDGKTFLNYTQNEGLGSNLVFSMLEDSHGNIWFGTVGGGIAVFDGESFVRFSEEEGLGHNDILSIVEDKAGNIWFSSYGGGVTKFQPSKSNVLGEGNFTIYSQKEGLAHNFVTQVLVDRNGILWFGTWGGGVCRFDGEWFTYFDSETGLLANSIYSLYEDKKGIIWFGTFGGGVTSFDGKSIVNYTEKEGLSNSSVMSIIEDKNGALWFGTSGGGVSRYDGNTFTQYSEEEGLSNNYVAAILEDDAGTMWFGTEGGGVSYFDQSMFYHFTEKSGLNNNYILGIIEDKKGNIWFGTWGGGINCYDGKSFSHFTSEIDLGGNAVWSILEDRNGKIWMGMYGGGVTCYTGEKFIQFKIDHGLSDNYVFNMLEDHEGNIWLGTWHGGVNKFTPASSGLIEDGTITQITEEQGLSNNDVRAMMEDRHGNIWFATNGGGVNYYDGQTIKRYSEKEGLSSNAVWSMMEDQSGNIWFGTYGAGISCFDGKSFTNYTVENGLSNNEVMSIVQDSSENGAIFVSTSKGLNYFSKNKNQTQSDDEFNSPYLISNYDYDDGLRALDFFYNSSLIDSKGRVWLGTGKSLEMLDLNKFSIAKKVPQPFLKRLDLKSQFVDFRLMKDSLKEQVDYTSVVPFENYPINPILNYSNNHLTFYFSAIDWAAPHKIRYSYRIPELGEEWSQPSEKTAADYRNLPYGEFTFQVCAIGESQIWSEPVEYKFTILPPWYHTMWARILYVISSLIILILIIRWRTAKLKQRQKELEVEVANATQEIRHQKEAVEHQKEQIEEAHKEITDSINYAERLQRSLMASKKILDENLQDYFVYFNPKEAVSGDFYWASYVKTSDADGRQQEKFVLVCADSTGHGVPGAIMSMMNMNSLKEALKDGHTSSDEILNQTRKTIIETLSNDGSSEGGKDGMDAALLIFNKEKTKLEFTLANNPLWLLRNNKLVEYRPDKMPVGKHDRQDVPFTKTTIDLIKGDVIYIFTDGYADQFGGEKGKKFKYSSLKELFVSMHIKTTDEQKETLRTTFNEWRKNLEQVDDVCVIGVRI